MQIQVSTSVASEAATPDEWSNDIQSATEALYRAVRMSSGHVEAGASV